MNRHESSPCTPEAPEGHLPVSPIQAAEDILRAAWIAELTTAIEDAETAVWACFELRAKAMAAIHEALLSRDPRGIAEAQQKLDAVEHDLADSLLTRGSVLDLLAKAQAGPLRVDQ
jgi:hypothetical protein